jgi:hypothetical protein
LSSDYLYNVLNALSIGGISGTIKHMEAVDKKVFGDAKIKNLIRKYYVELLKRKGIVDPEQYN